MKLYLVAIRGTHKGWVKNYIRSFTSKRSKASFIKEITKHGFEYATSEMEV